MGKREPSVERKSCLYSESEMHKLVLCHYSSLFQQALSNFSAQTTFLPVLLDRCSLYSVSEQETNDVQQKARAPLLRGLCKIQGALNLNSMLNY